MRIRSGTLLAILTCAGLVANGAGAGAQAITVSVQVQIRAKTVKGRSPRAPILLTGQDTVVAWLTPVDSLKPTENNATIASHSYVLTQKDKQFIPHLLVIPTGSTVAFPNMDPFFHNVFSLFNGRRFDLGLYESGTRRSVRFDHEGISYIFCNIHPEMAAVIVSLSTPYYTIANADGLIVLPKVPPGTYDLDLWSENVSAKDQAAAKQKVQVFRDDLRLAPITLQQTMPIPSEHLNKFGEAYQAPDPSLY